MAAFFLDSSAVFKRYISEFGSSGVLGITDPVVGNDIYLGAISLLRSKPGDSSQGLSENSANGQGSLAKDGVLSSP